MTLSSCEGIILANGIGGTFDDGMGPVKETLCLDNGSKGLVVDVGGGTYPGDVSWSLTFPSGIVETGVAGSRKIGECASPYPSPQPSVTLIPTARAPPCELYMIELFDAYGDG